MQKLKNENEYIYIQNFHFKFKYKKNSLVFRPFHNKNDNFYYIGIYQKKENELIFIKKFDTYRYFLQPLKFKNLENCLMYCKETSELLKNNIIKVL